MAARADLAEQAVRLTELSLVPLLIAALSRQLGELDVYQRLVGLRARLARQLGARASAASICSRAAVPAEPSRTRATARCACISPGTCPSARALASPSCARARARSRFTWPQDGQFIVWACELLRSADWQHSWSWLDMAGSRQARGMGCRRR